MTALETAFSAIQTAPDADTAFTAFSTAGHLYGFDNACFTLMEDHTSAGLKTFHGFATDYPQDWMAYYRGAGYLDFDPVVYQALRGRRPFSWQEAVRAQQQDQTVSATEKKTSVLLMREAADAGLAAGIGVPMITRLGERSAVGLSSEQADLNTPASDLAELGLLANVFHERFLSFYGADVFDAITARERDVLSWSAEGKTDAEIAILLGISAATVRFHWKNIFNKLKAVNKVNATAKALRLGLISVSLVGIAAPGKN